jgi:hypothetical protein
MGLNTVILLLNDALEDIRNDMKLGEKIADAISKSGQPQKISCGGFDEALRVVEIHHESNTVLLAAGSNTIDIIGHISSKPTTDKQDLKQKSVETILQKISRDLGYSVSTLKLNRKDGDECQELKGCLKKLVNS